MRVPFLLGIVGGAFGHELEWSEQSLKKSLMAGYDTTVRPVKDPSKTLVITTYVRLLSLRGLSEQDGAFQTRMSVSMSWGDDYLSWNESARNNISEFYVHPSQIWLPNFRFYNISKLELLGIEDAMIESSGQVSLTFEYLVDFDCTFRLARYPFDVQECTMEFGSLQSTRHILYMPMADQNFTHLMEDGDDGEFEIIGFESREQKTRMAGKGDRNLHFYKTIIYTIKIRRQSTFYIYVYVAPTILIMSSGIIGSFTASATQGPRNEKISNGLACLLAVGVYLEYATTRMPRSSGSLPMLGRFTFGQLCFTVVMIVITTIGIAVERYNVHADKEVPAWLLRITRVKINDTEPPAVFHQLSLLAQARTPLVRMLDEIRKYLLRADNRALCDEKEAYRVLIWHRVMSVVEFYSLLVFGLSYGIVCWLLL